jgi:hypothetical protein
MNMRRNLLLTLLCMSMLLIPAPLRGQEPANITDGITGQGERFTLVVDGNTIVLLSVGIYVENHDCKTYHTVTKATGLGYVEDNYFHVIIRSDEGVLVVSGIPGWHGYVQFVSGPGQPCKGNLYTPWWIPGKSQPPLPEYGNESSSVPSPTLRPTPPPPTATPTPLRRLDESWEGVPLFMRPTSVPDPEPEPEE